MISSASVNWLAHARSALRRLGMPGVLGLLLVMGGAWVWFLELPLAKQGLLEEQEQVEHLRQQLRESSMPSTQPTVSLLDESERAWQALWSGLPEAPQGRALQAKVLNAAQEAGVLPLSVQFSGAPIKGQGAVWRQRLTLPVEATYPQLRAWLASVLQEPNISLDALQMSRADVATDRVKAQVGLSIWWRHTPTLEGQP